MRDVLLALTKVWRVWRGEDVWRGLEGSVYREVGVFNLFFAWRALVRRRCLFRATCHVFGSFVC